MKKKNIRFWYSLICEQDEILATYLLNPPYPHESTAGFLREMFSNYVLPLAALEQGCCQADIEEYARMAVRRLRERADLIERKCLGKEVVGGVSNNEGVNLTIPDHKERHPTNGYTTPSKITAPVCVDKDVVELDDDLKLERGISVEAVDPFAGTQWD